MAIATSLGLGYLPKAPGTWGSLAGILIYGLTLFYFPFAAASGAPPSLGSRVVWAAWTALPVTLVLAAVGVWAADRAADFRRTQRPAVRGDRRSVRPAPHLRPVARAAELEIFAAGIYTFSRLRYLEAVSRAASRIPARRPGHHGGRLGRRCLCGAGALVCPTLGYVKPPADENASQRSSTPHWATTSKPRIERITPDAAIPGGEILIAGSGFGATNSARPRVMFGDAEGSLLIAADNRLLAQVPEGSASPMVRVTTGHGDSNPFAMHLGLQIADNLHPVGNPAVDAEGNIYVTFSGQRGQKVPVSLYKVTPTNQVKPFVTEMMNPTGLAVDANGVLYVSCRNDGTIHRVTPDGRSEAVDRGHGHRHGPGV